MIIKVALLVSIATQKSDESTAAKKWNRIESRVQTLKDSKGYDVVSTM